MKKLNTKAMSEAIEKIVSSLGYDVLKAVNVNQFQSAVNDFMPGTMFEIEKQTLLQCIRIGVGDKFIQAVSKTGEEQKRTVVNIQKSLLEDYAIHKDRVDCIIGAFAQALKMLQLVYESSKIDCYCNNNIINQDKAQAHKVIESLLYDNNKKVFDDYLECLKLKCLRKLIEQGDTDAKFVLAILYLDGIGLSQNNTEGIKLLREAAEYGNLMAQFVLAISFFGGNGVSQDYTEAAKWCRKAAEQGNADAQLMLASLYISGNGVSQDYVEAAKWCLKAAEQGNADAQLGLANLYFNGYGVSQDYAEAAKWCRKAAEQGNADAQFMLSGLYISGNGVSQDYAEAAKWCRKAAEQGNTDAQLGLSGLYFRGYGVSQNYAEAAKWCRKVAEQGDTDAQNALKKIESYL